MAPGPHLPQAKHSPTSVSRVALVTDFGLLHPTTRGGHHLRRDRRLGSGSRGVTRLPRLPKQDCDQTYYRTEIAVSWVRDQADADVYVM
jgi:hypothetical protein